MNANEFLKDDVKKPVFEELARRIGRTLDEIDLGDSKEWPYGKYTWTKAEEDEFSEWLTNWMYKNRRKLDMSYARKTWIRDHIVPFWITMYSWKYES